MYNQQEYPEFNKLKRRDKNFVWAYLSTKFIEKSMKSPTFNDAFLSYVASYKIDVDEFLKIQCYVKDYNDDGKLCYVLDNDTDSPDKTSLVITNSELYAKHLKKSEDLYFKCEKAINEIRLQDFKVNDQTKHLELINVIHKDAIYGDDLKFKSENRKLAVDIYGLKQKEPTVKIDLYEMVGKRYVENVKNSSSTDLKNFVVSEQDLNSVNLSDDEE